MNLVHSPGFLCHFHPSSSCFSVLFPHENTNHLSTGLVKYVYGLTLEDHFLYGGQNFFNFFFLFLLYLKEEKVKMFLSDNKNYIKVME